MNETLDIVATTNPAYCSLVLLSFANAYSEAAGAEPHVCLSFLAIPVAMSSAVTCRFKGTNIKTGLLEWINRNPELRLELPGILREAVPIVRAALLFGFRTGLFELTHEAGLRVHTEQIIGGLPKDPPKADVTRRHYAAARSFGAWCGDVRSVSTIFMSLGVMP